jgi:hypothetical protein
MAYGFGVTADKQKLDELVQTIKNKYFAASNNSEATIIDSNETIHIHMDGDAYIIVANDKSNISPTKTIKRKSVLAAIKQIDGIFAEARKMRWTYTKAYFDGRLDVPFNSDWMSVEYVTVARRDAGLI